MIESGPIRKARETGLRAPAETLTLFATVAATITVPIIAVFAARRYAEAMKQMGQYYLPKVRVSGNPGQNH